MEKSFLDQGMDVRVILRGKNKDKLKMEYSLFGRVTMYKMTEDGSIREGSFLSNLQKIGFKEVEFNNGWNFRSGYDLNPPNETKEFSKTLDGMGLGKPLRI